MPERDALPFEIDRVLAEFVDGGHHASIGLISALEYDEIRKFPRDIEHCRCLDIAAQDRPASTRIWQPNRGYKAAERALSWKLLLPDAIKDWGFRTVAIAICPATTCKPSEY